MDHDEEYISNFFRYLENNYPDKLCTLYLEFVSKQNQASSLHSKEPASQILTSASDMRVKSTSSRGDSAPVFNVGILPPSLTTEKDNSCKKARSRSTKKKAVKAPSLPLSPKREPRSPIPTDHASDVKVKATYSRGLSVPVFDEGIFPLTSTIEDDNGCKVVRTESFKENAAKAPSIPFSPRRASKPGSRTPSSPTHSSGPDQIRKTTPSYSAEQSVSSALSVSSGRTVVHSPTVEGPNRIKPPRLFLHDQGKWTTVCSLMMEHKIVFTRARSTVSGIRIQTATSSDHRCLTRLLRDRGYEYHTYALEDERHLSVVIWGLPVYLSTDRILEDLKSQSLPVFSVHRIFQTTTKVPMDLVLVHLERSQEGKKIFNIQVVCTLSGLKVKVSRGRGIPGQCHGCQMYGHSKRFCNARPRCVKCLDDHATADCPRKGLDSKDPPSCVLCQQKGHPANYRGCPKAPRKTQPERRPFRRVQLP